IVLKELCCKKQVLDWMLTLISDFLQLLRNSLYLLVYLYLLFHSQATHLLVQLLFPQMFQLLLLQLHQACL
ncbi:hypothetical protein EBX31_06870, partial [bacterium]|nr:hypothetical protein [bacterium]